jgi:hypothetical protein
MDLQQPVESVWELCRNVCQKVYQESRGHLFERIGGSPSILGGPLGGMMVAPEMRKILVKLSAMHKDSAGLLYCSSTLRNGATIAKLPRPCRRDRT